MDYRSTYSNNNQTRYFEQFENVFLYKFDNCHSIEDFWYTYANTGNNNKNDIMNEFDICINEGRGKIDPDDFDSDYYEENDMKDDASRILDIFMSIQEYNDFDEDEELNEV